MEVNTELNVVRIPEFQTLMKMSSDPYDNMTENPDLAYLYKYVQSRYNLKSKGYQLNVNDSSVFYKLRHNVLKNYISVVTNLPNIAERPFSDFGIPSNRTPDLLMEDPDKFVLIEYTVCNKYLTAMEVKESMGKYDQEVRIMKSRKKVFDYYILFGLDQEVLQVSEQILNICKDLELPISRDPTALLEELRDGLLYLQWHIQSTIPELLLNVSNPMSMPKSELIDFTSPFPTNIRTVGVKRTRNMYIRKLLMSKTKELLLMARRKSPTLRYKIILNFRDNLAFLTFDKNGLSKNEMTSLLQSGDDRLFDHCIFKGTYDDVEEPFVIYGDVELNINDVRLKQTEEWFDDNNYVNRVFLKSKFSKVDTLSSCPLDVLSLNVRSKYEEILKSKHSHPKIKKILKNPFIFPMSVGMIYLTQDESYENKIWKFNSRFQLTNMLLKSSRKMKRTTKIINRSLDYEKMSEAEKTLSILGKKIRTADLEMKKVSSWKIKPADITDSPELQNLITDWRSCKKLFLSYVTEDTRLTYGNRVTIPMSTYKKLWLLETQHYNKDHSEIEVYPNDDFDEKLSEYRNLVNMLFVKRSDISPDQVYSNTSPTGYKLRELCLEMKEELVQAEISFRSTNLCHNLLLISRLCYSLSYYSNIKLNKNDFCFDNLGYENVRLLIKGGKKIISSRRSRMFKLLIPINSQILHLCNSSSVEIVSLDGCDFMITPWRQFKQDYLKLGMEIYFNFSNYYITSFLESSLSLDDYQKFISLKVLNLFSQRRKIEVWFSSLRYIYFNSLGTHSSVLELIPDMVEYNYDSYIYLIQNLFLRNYLHIYNEMKNNRIYDFFHEISYTNFDLCAEKFDEALFMTRAPFDPDNEHMINMKNVLKTHDSFNQEVGFWEADEILGKTAVDCSDDNYIEHLFDSDFNFDPKICFLVGKHASSIISSSTNKSSLTESFNEIMNCSFTKIQTSKGMRDSEGSFWGKKGFQVIYKKQEIYNDVSELLKDFPVESKEFDKFCNKTHVSFLDKLQSMSGWRMEFDMKDKVQNKGNREIYVMSDKTKMMQQPLEKFFKKLCTFLPNEIIHKKSHDRPKFIHSKIYEYSQITDKITFCTLDCRKWAPKSNLWKYVYFVMGMKDILPQEFVIYFLMVWKKMFNKVVRFQKRYVEILKANDTTKDLAKHLLIREDGDYELKMPYSFMMGIFNYLSSLFHAASQLFFDKEIASKLGSSMRLMAHSDDSGGIIFSRSLERNLETFRYYEYFQKSCNHLMSKKKSVLSNVSFELISIMYNDKKLIPMTHKFLSNLAYDPKGTGWQEDISTVVSKVVDLFSNGGTLLQCYAMMLAQGEMLRKFYHLPRSERLSEIPLAFGGIFNMHPLHMIMLGASAQEVMLDYIEVNRARDFRINLYKLFTGGYIIGRGGKMNYTLPYFILEDKRLLLNDEQDTLLSDLSHYMKDCTIMDTIKYINSLKLQKFRYSLEGVDTFKILFSSLFFPHKGLKIDDNSVISLQDLTSMYLTQGIIGLRSEKTHYDYSNEHNYLKASEGLKYKYCKFNQHLTKTCKPIIYHTFMNLGFNLPFETVSNLIAYNSNDKVKNIMSNPKKWEIMSSWILDNLPGEKEDKLKQLSVLERRDVEKRRSAYLFMPSGTSVDTLERFWTFTLMYCTKRYEIYSDPPQFYTMEKFEFWNLKSESLKHHFLLIKLFLEDKNYTKNLKLYLENIEGCQSCESNMVTIRDLKELKNLRDLDYFEKYQSFLPFATYESPQTRGRMVWYGNPNFTLYTKFGYVKHVNVDGLVKTYWYVGESEILDELWHIYKIFCGSRGIYVQDPVYGYTGELSLRLSFNDLNVPYIAPLRSYSMILDNSFVQHTSITPYLLTKYEDGYYYHDQKVDLNIYHIYDINSMFYQDHNLEVIKDLILPHETKISRNILMNNFLSSQTYQTLSLDDHHTIRKSMVSKYKNEGLLGSAGSFTRALCLGDLNGTIRYKSSLNIEPLSLGVFETQTIQNVPILDLMKSISYIRVTYAESKILQKIGNEEELDIKDVEILDNMVSKTGLASTAASIVNYKYVYRTLNIGDLLDTPVGICLDLIKTLVNCIHECMAEFPKSHSSWQYTASRRSWWSAMKSMKVLQSSFRDFGYLFLMGLLRAQNDDPLKFWNIRKQNPLAASLSLNPVTVSNTFYFFRGFYSLMIRKFKDDYVSFLNQKRHFLNAFMDTKPNSLDYKVQVIKSEVSDNLLEQNFICLDEDGLDEVYGNEMPSEYDQRIYSDEFEDLIFYVNGNLDFLKIQEYSLLNNFNTLKIISKFNYVSFNWLGPCKTEMSVIDNLAHYVVSYPGTQSAPYKLSLSPMPKEIATTSFIDLFEVLEKKRLENEQESKSDQENADRETGSPSYYLEDYLTDVITKDNIKITPAVAKLFKKKDQKLEEILESMSFDHILKREIRAKKKFKNYLPGFSGLLDSDKIHAELKELFGSNYHFLLSGQVCLNKNTVKFLMRTCKELYKSSNNHHKALITMVLSMLKDCILTDQSDAWFIDSVTKIFDEIDDQYDIDEDDTIFMAPDPDNNQLEYTAGYGVDYA